MNLSQANLELLKSNGLRVEKVPFQDGYRILKPNSVTGNFVEGYEMKLFDKNLELAEILNSPISHLFEYDSKFCFYVWDFVPGPGPGDFQNSFDNIEECLLDVIDYYFGDSTRMNKKSMV